MIIELKEWVFRIKFTKILCYYLIEIGSYSTGWVILIHKTCNWDVWLYWPDYIEMLGNHNQKI